VVAQRKRGGISPALIRRMVRRIVQRFSPEQIVLFGSQARGDAGPDSDVDLLVVLPVVGSKRDLCVEIGLALQDFRVPKDILVTTPEEMARFADISGTLAYIAGHEGKLMYARP
jgi:uncharacterized protein